jgi:hypothetical protein
MLEKDQSKGNSRIFLDGYIGRDGNLVPKIETTISNMLGYRGYNAWRIIKTTMRGSGLLAKAGNYNNPEDREAIDRALGVHRQTVELALTYFRNQNRPLGDLIDIDTLEAWAPYLERGNVAFRQQSLRRVV